MEKFKYFYPIQEAEDVASVIDGILASEKIEISTYHPKKKVDIVKNIRPKIGVMSVGRLEVSAEHEEVLGETHPFKDIDGIFVETYVQDGSSVKPLDIKKLFTEKGILVGEPIKTESHLVKL